MSIESGASASSRWLALASICIATFLIPQSISAVNIALPVIADELNADAVQVSWLSTVNLWGSVLLMLPAGRIADMFGRKRIYLLGTFSFALSSLLVSVTVDVDSLLWVRLLQGLSSSFVFGTAVAIVSSLFSDSNRGTALGLTSTSVYLGLTCGPLVGGWLTELLGWRSVFWAPVPLLLAAMALVLITIKGDWKSAERGRFDWVGSLLFAGWTTALFFGLSGLPELPFMGLILAGFGLLYVFVRHQIASTSPLVRIRALQQNRVISRSMLTSLFMYGAHAPILFLLSLYLQYLQGMSPAESGQLILLQALIMASLAPFAGRLSDRFEPRIIATLGCLLFTAGFVVLLTINTGSGLVPLIIALVLLGTGFGLFSSPNTNAALSSVDKDRLGIASALMNLARTLGNMFSMAIVVLLFNQLLGETAIEPERYPELLQVIKVALALACGYTLIAAWCSYSRGNIR